ncbi:MAG: hypothetical protein ACR2NM_10395 [Bythopirellula sp.]
MPSPTTVPPSQETKRPQGNRWRQAASLPQLAKKDDSNRTRDIYDSILWRIDAKRQANDTLAVGMTGCQRKSGASTIAANLAVRASDQQRGRILLMDASWQLPGMLKTFEVSQELGVYDILSGEVSPRECEPHAITDNLDLLCRGKWNEDQPARVQQDLVAEMLSDLKTEYSLILVDLPEANELRSALPLARELDGTLLVTRFEAVTKTQVQNAYLRLQEDGVRVWGSILNRYHDYVPSWLRNWV